MSVKMKLTRIGYPLIVLVAGFLANNAAAAASVHIVQQTAPAQASTETFHAGGQLCLDADSTANCWVGCTQSYDNNEPIVSFNATPSIIAPAPSPYRVRLRAEPRRHVMISAPPVVGPSLTILFGNFRI